MAFGRGPPHGLTGWKAERSDEESSDQKTQCSIQRCSKAKSTRWTSQRRRGLPRGVWDPALALGPRLRREPHERLEWQPNVDVDFHIQA